MKRTNEETVTLPREKYDELLSHLGMAIGMLRGLGVRFDREVSRSNCVIFDGNEMKRMRDDCREVAQAAQDSIPKADEEDGEADE